MKKAGLFSILIFAVSALTTAAHAQDMAKKEAPKPAASASQAVLDQWNDIGRNSLPWLRTSPRTNLTSNRPPPCRALLSD